MRLISVSLRILHRHSCRCVCPLATAPFVTSPVQLLRKSSQSEFWDNARRINYLSTAHPLNSSNLPLFCRFSNTRPLALTMATTSQNTVPDSKEQHVCPDDNKKQDAQENSSTEVEQQAGLSVSHKKSAHPADTSQLSKRAQKKVCGNTAFNFFYNLTMAGCCKIMTGTGYWLLHQAQTVKVTVSSLGST